MTKYKKPLFEALSPDLESSIYISHQLEKDLLRKDYWHFHNAYELVFLTSGKGKRFVGQKVSEYRHGDLVLLSPNIPHNTLFKEHIGQTFEQYVILFDLSIFKRFFTTCKEFNHISRLFQNMGGGIAFEGNTKKKVGEQIKKMKEAKGFHRVMLFFEILNLMGQSKEYELLVPTCSMDFPALHENKILFINDFINLNFREKLSSSGMASEIGMTNSSFCRFYKRSTGKTFKKALNEVRIQNSCFLLKDTKMPIEGVALESGFTSIPLFYKFFKRMMKKTPSEYREEI